MESLPLTTNGKVDRKRLPAPDGSRPASAKTFVRPRDTFELRLGMPNTPGKTLYFPTVQRCVKGVHRWIQIPVKGKAEPESPAPGVTLVKSTGGHG